MYRNRVDPIGEIHAVPQRMAWYGNRGCLHDRHGTLRRSHQGTRWITCVLAFKNRRRPLLQPGRYTELFFLDEATAYAAGHRPCAECRRADFVRFRDLWKTVYGEDRVPLIDARLHAARLQGKERRLLPVAADDLPVGAMALVDGMAVLRGANGWHRWGFDGYTGVEAPKGTIPVLTPEPVLRLMAAGLPVEMHRSAGGLQNDCFVQ